MAVGFFPPHAYSARMRRLTAAAGVDRGGLQHTRHPRSGTNRPASRRVRPLSLPCSTTPAGGWGRGSRRRSCATRPLGGRRFPPRGIQRSAPGSNRAALQRRIRQPLRARFVPLRRMRNRRLPRLQPNSTRRPAGPAFAAPVAGENIRVEWDRSWGMNRRAVLCSRCDARLGHVFNDGPPPERPPLLHQFGGFAVHPPPRLTALMPGLHGSLSPPPRVSPETTIKFSNSLIYNEFQIAQIACPGMRAALHPTTRLPCLVTAGFSPPR